RAHSRRRPYHGTRCVWNHRLAGNLQSLRRLCARPAAHRPRWRAWDSPSVTEEVSVGQYLALPYNPFVGNPAKNDVILDGCVNLPNLFPLPGTIQERRIIIAGWLTHPEHLSWE